MNVFYSLFTEETVEAIRRAGEEIDERAWFLGDEVINLDGILQARKSDIIRNPGRFDPAFEDKLIITSKNDLMKFVADESGFSVSTIKGYVVVAEFYTDEARVKYEILPMSHYSWAMGFGEQATQVLDAGLKLVDLNYGRPVPLRVMQYLFPSINQIPEALEQIDQIDGIEEILALAEYDNGNDDESVPPLVYHFLKNIGRIANYIGRAVSEWNIPNQKKQEIVEHVKRLSELIKEAKNPVSTIDN